MAAGTSGLPCGNRSDSLSEADCSSPLAEGSLQQEFTLSDCSSTEPDLHPVIYISIYLHLSVYHLSISFYVPALSWNPGSRGSTGAFPSCHMVVVVGVTPRTSGQSIAGPSSQLSSPAWFGTVGGKLENPKRTNADTG